MTNTITCSWEEFVKPMAQEDSCPMDHREYIQSGHLAWVIGDEPCVMLDW